MPKGTITFSRVCIPEKSYPSFRKSKKLVRKPLVQLNGTIEDCIGALQVLKNSYKTEIKTNILS